MIFKFKQTLVGLLIVLCSTPGLAHEHGQSIFKQMAQHKVAELLSISERDGFITYKAGELQLERKTEYPIFVELQEGRWYQFAVVGDPRATKIEMKLGMEGVGDFITDKFKPTTTHEFWTQFSFICPRSGKYLLTFYQRGAPKHLFGHVAILQRPAKNETARYTFK